MFDKASRLKLRFDSPQGLLSVEDLWDLPLTSTRANKANLNDVAKAVSRELKAESEEDFVNPKSGADELLQLKMDVVKHVIGTVQNENAAALAERDKKDKKAKILEIISRKQDKELEDKSLDDLQTMIGSL